MIAKVSQQFPTSFGDTLNGRCTAPLLARRIFQISVKKLTSCVV
jgi:hypothetical protein